jgi:Mg-chelatase subunit ChlD
VGFSQSLSANDPLRTLYFNRISDAVALPERDAVLVRLILDRAKKLVRHASRPLVSKSASLLDFPDGELDIEASLEQNPFLDNPAQIRVTQQDPKRFAYVAMLDCSSSMSGDKHLLASVAVAVLLLQVAAEDAGLVAFHSKAQVIKPLGSQTPAAATILKFLQTRPRGFTNIQLGLTKGYEQTLHSSRRRVGLLATDGRYTEGGDPVDTAKRFDFLAVLHLHGPGSSLEASQAIAQAGHGICLEVNEFSELPAQLYEALRRISRY